MKRAIGRHAGILFALMIAGSCGLVIGVVIVGLAP